MALQVWLPLNGNIENKGCSGVNITSANPVFVNDGKLGKCYYNEYEKTIATDPIEIGDEFSICYWVKYNSLEYPRTHVGICHSNGSYAGGADRKGWDIGHGPNGGGVYNFDINDGTNVERFYFNVSGLTELNVWKHFAFTCSLSNRTIKLYINGVLVDTKPIGSNITSFKISYPLTIDYIYGWYLDGYLNDFRVYDNVLSEKEIYDISKCLVIHYPLNDPYLEPTVNFINHIGVGNQRIDIVENGVDVSTAAGDAYCNLYLSTSTIIGETYTLSFDVDNMGVNDICGFGIYNNGMLYTTPIYNGKNSILMTSFPFQTTVLTFDDSNRSNSNIIHIRNFQFEKKDHATPYVNGTRTVNAIHDNSGFDNDTSIYGELSLDSSTARYGHSIVLDGSSYISRNPLTANTIQSASFWLFVPSVIPETGIVFLDGCSQMAFGYWSSGSTMICACTNSCTCIFSTDYLIKNSWNHIVILRPTGSGYPTLYVNGVLRNNTGGYDCWSAGTTEFTIGRKLTYTAYPFSGKISDFRLYSTVLSENDIQDLYRNSASIYNNGNFDSYEFSEADSSLNIAKTGITYDSEFSEYSRNLFDKNNVAFNSYNYDTNKDAFSMSPYDGKCCPSKSIPIKPDTYYVLSYDESQITINLQAFNTVFWDITGKTMVACLTNSANGFVNKVKFKSPANAYWVSFSNYGWLSNEDQQKLVNTLQLEEDEVYTEYCGYDINNVEVYAKKNRLNSKEFIEI